MYGDFLDHLVKQSRGYVRKIRITLNRFYKLSRVGGAFFFVLYLCFHYARQRGKLFLLCFVFRE